ncbi:hypothetical protein EMCLV086L [Equine molluscum contagiosum-like virus]|nr:hypothetical protein EMCLV086L [Equine molluscum contagiosum-like virus]
MVLLFFLFIISKKAVPMRTVPPEATHARRDEDTRRRLALLKDATARAREELADLDERVAAERARLAARAWLAPAPVSAPTPAPAPRLHPYKVLRMSYDLAEWLDLF